MARKLKATAMAQTLMLGKLPDSPPTHRVGLRLYLCHRLILNSKTIGATPEGKLGLT
ncbi:hypothetical protein H6G89_01010 [Oscillatoria sp. FACHB-1407]|uniref:hypothetical protein n=1 Tax=Oscillatoria sp. FACHB-1407 TaxID=2692847 RepID=UPI001684F7E1|nr:hypothetical protein [Oscillatoria sp. FACHB-1407]MBD2459610.1 hypothetical protein [Oscillatoria sp. FACHB-1407]